MSTGSKAADERIARIVADAPDFTDEQFSLFKTLFSGDFLHGETAERLAAQPAQVSDAPAGRRAA